MVKQESFKDSNFTIPNGFFAWYSNKGFADSTGYVNEGRKTSCWNYFNNDTKPYLSIWFNKGKLEKTEDHTKNIVRYADDTVDSTALKPVEKGKEEGDTVSKKQAKFPGGPDAWQKFLFRNLQIPGRLLDIGHGGVIVVEFVIDKEGNVTDINIRQSLEWSADAEVIRLMKRSPKWIPAEMDGRKVFYRQVQSITMSVSSR